MEQHEVKLKPGREIIHKGPLTYQLDQKGRPIRFQPWLGDAFAFLYDFFMTRSVFPRKLRADITLHEQILREQLADCHQIDVLELGTGSGSAAGFLPNDNRYVGTDISTGLLRKAAKRFHQAGFQDAAFYVASGDDLPFATQSFELCLCILSLNFIGNTEKLFTGVHATLRPNGRFLCCVPIPERNQGESLIRGTLLTEVRLQKLCRETGFDYQRIDRKNGALLYFDAIRSENEVDEQVV